MSSVCAIFFNCRFQILAICLLGSICLLTSCDENSDIEKDARRLSDQIGAEVSQQTEEVTTMASDLRDKIADKTSEMSETIIDKTSGLSKLVPNSDVIQKTSKEEIQKTFAIEYKTVEIRSDLSPEQAQSILTQLGNDRWDCYPFVSNLETAKLICKRRPLSAIRALLGAGVLLW